VLNCGLGRGEEKKRKRGGREECEASAYFSLHLWEEKRKKVRKRKKRKERGRGVPRSARSYPFSMSVEHNGRWERERGKKCSQKREIGGGDEHTLYHDVKRKEEGERKWEFWHAVSLIPSRRWKRERRKKGERGGGVEKKEKKREEGGQIALCYEEKEGKKRGKEKLREEKRKGGKPLCETSFFFLTSPARGRKKGEEPSEEKGESCPEHVPFLHFDLGEGGGVRGKKEYEEKKGKKGEGRPPVGRIPSFFTCY